MIPLQSVATDFNPRRLIHGVESSWYALQTLPRHEKAVVEDLQNENIDCLVPPDR